MTDPIRQRSQEAVQQYKGISVFASLETHETCWAVCQRVAPKSGRALDLGAGHGAFTRRLLDAGYKVTANDFDLKGWAVPEVVPMAVDLNTPFAEAFPGPYDLIVAIDIIEHVENPRGFLRECRQLLRPGGVLIVALPNLLDYDSRQKFWRRGIFYHFSPEHIHATGHITILPCWLVEHHFEVTGWAVAEKTFGARRTAWSGTFAWLRSLVHPVLRRVSYLSTTRNGWDEYTCGNAIYALRSATEDSV